MTVLLILALLLINEYDSSENSISLCRSLIGMFVG